MKKYLKMVSRTDFDFLSDDCPAEPQSAAVYSDIETHELYLSLRFLNSGNKDITTLEGELLLFDSEKANLPYIKLPLYYDLLQRGEEFYVADEDITLSDSFAAPGEFFGADRMIKLPESYFKRFEIRLARIGFGDGNEASITKSDVTTVKSFGELNSLSRVAYDKVNIYKKTEEKYPAVCLPLKNDSVWICCCGEKNPLTGEKCIRCGRRQDWLFEHLSEDKLSETVKEITDMKRPENAYFAREKRQKKLYSRIELRERREKQREAESVSRRVEIQQMRSDRKRRRLLNMLLIWLVICTIAMLFTILK